ncbi:DUF2982 domain-containing protein [Rheinheimera gaetbuli]
MQPVQIEANSSKGGAKLLLASSATMLILVLIASALDQISWWFALLIVACVLGIFAGWAKLAEPKFFLQFDDDGVRFFHRLGSWHLPWQCFLYSGVPQLNEQSMAFIAFKVTDYDALLKHIPLRLAVKLMTEQRPLYMEAVRLGCAQGQCATELLSEKDYFDTAKQRYHGVTAAFAWRMQRLASATGFDIFVPVSFADADAQQLCRQINQYRLQLIRNTVT